MMKQNNTKKPKKATLPGCCNAANLRYLMQYQNCGEDDPAFSLKVKDLRRSGPKNVWYGPLSAKEVVELAQEIQEEGKLVICDVEPDPDWQMAVQ